MQQAWFNISNDGWRRLNEGRPLSSLVVEALQNALDQDVSDIDIKLDEHCIKIQDDSKSGFDHPEQVFTIFDSNKGDDPTQRGRYGRGLKELISVMDSAIVETVGFTVRFDREGRATLENSRKRGSMITMYRHSPTEEVESAAARLRLVIPSDGVLVRVNSKQIIPPTLYARLKGCELQTVVYEEGIERVAQRATYISLFNPKGREPPHLFEMGIPVQPMETPWHINIHQRIPLRDGRDRVADDFRLRILGTLFESLSPKGLSKEVMRSPWVGEVLSRCEVSDDALRAYSETMFPRGAVLPSNTHHDDAATQRGARVLDTRAMTSTQLSALGRVLETSEQFVSRVRQQADPVRAPHPAEQRALSFYGELAKRILGRPIRMRLVRQPPGLDGTIESATFSRQRSEMAINVLGKLDLSNPMGPENLGILLHELAHAEVETHDNAFIHQLEWVSGRAAQIMALEGRTIAAKCGIELGGLGGDS